MIRRSTWTLVAVFLVLVALAWWARQQKETAEAQVTPEPSPTALPRLLPDLTPDAVVRIILEEPGTGRKVVLERLQVTPTPEPEAEATATPGAPEAQWTVVEPAGAEAPEPWRINSALEGLVYAHVQATLAPDTDPATVGLAGPAQRIILITQNGDEIRLWIGVSTPLQNGYYLRVEGQPAIMAVGQYAIASFLEILNQLSPPQTPTMTPTP